VRRPRRSERYPSLVRVDTINGQPADEVAEGTPFDELPCAWPSRALRARRRRPDAQRDRVADADRPRLARDDHRRRARGQDRGAARDRRRAAGREELEVASCSPASGPRRRPSGRRRPVEPSPRPRGAARDAQAQAVERAVETAKRDRRPRRHAVVLVDTLDALRPPAARRAMAAARASSTAAR
jgi:transcription termination factor Rho